MCQQGCCAPLLETQRQKDAPFEIPHFPRRCIYKLQNAACNARSENAKGSLCGCLAQTSFWAEMQKKWTIASSAFPQPTRRGREIRNGENLNISGRFIEITQEGLTCCVKLLVFLGHFPPFHPSRIPTLLPSSSVTMYNPVPTFLTDPAWRSRIFPTVPMLSVTGRLRGYAWYGESPWG